MCSMGFSLSHLLYGRHGNPKSTSLQGFSILRVGGLSFPCETSWVGWMGIVAKLDLVRIHVSASLHLPSISLTEKGYHLWKMCIK